MIDLYCGLFQSEFLLRTNAAIKQFVACRTKQPEHVPLSICDDFPCAISFKLGTVRDFKDTPLSARFTRKWEVRILAAKSADNSIGRRFSRRARFYFLRIMSHPVSALASGRLSRTLFRAISSICAGNFDREVIAALKAISSRFCNVSLLSASQSPSMACTFKGAIALVGANSRKSDRAFGTGKFVHE